MPVPDPMFLLKLKFQVRPTNPIKMEILIFFYANLWIRGDQYMELKEYETKRVSHPLIHFLGTPSAVGAIILGIYNLDGRVKPCLDPRNSGALPMFTGKQWRTQNFFSF